MTTTKHLDFDPTSDDNLNPEVIYRVETAIGTDAETPSAIAKRANVDTVLADLALGYLVGVGRVGRMGNGTRARFAAVGA